jgi:hypothetical protein
MTCHRVGLVGLLSGMALLQGCASYDEGAPNQAWFSRETAAVEGRTQGRVALLVTPQVQTTVLNVRRSVRLQIGPIAEQAMLAALGDGLQGRVQQIYAAPPAAGGYNATLVLDAVRFEHQERRLWFIWLPPLSGISQYETSTRLAFDLSLLDEQGKPVWKRTYDDDAGRVTWTTPSADSTPLPKDIGRLAHEAAWRLSQQAVRDLREWMEAQRMQPREL